jgi:hypothetical protein
MTRKEYEELKQLFREGKRALREDDLSPRERDKIQQGCNFLSGRLMSMWIPMDVGRRIAAVAFAVIGLGGILHGPAYLAWMWLMLPMMSPRLVGEVWYAIGEFRRGFGV